jgi:hypothetical protein
MATDKRARQRANREAKQAELDKARRREDMISRAKRIGIWVAVGIVLFVIANLIWGGGDSESAAAALTIAL